MNESASSARLDTRQGLQDAATRVCGARAAASFITCTELGLSLRQTLSLIDFGVGERRGR